MCLRDNTTETLGAWGRQGARQRLGLNVAVYESRTGPPPAAGPVRSSMGTSIPPATSLASRCRPKGRWERCCPLLPLPSPALTTLLTLERVLHLQPPAQAGRACWPCSSELKPCQVCCIYFNLGLLTETWVRKRFLVSANPVPHVHTNTLAQRPCPAPSSQQFGLLPSLLALNSCSQNCCTNGCHYCLICSQIHSCPFKPICSFARII